MAAARNLPLPQALTHTITIDNTFTPNHPGVIVQPGDTVNFQNNSGYDITIQFQANPPGIAVYTNMILTVNNGTTNGFTAPNSDAAANYFIYQGAIQETGPFVVQVGSGPMFAHISMQGGVVTYTPEAVAVPLGSITTGLGELAMKSAVPNTSFPINWTNNNDPFNPPIQATDGNSHPVSPNAATTDFPYSAGSGLAATGGGGKIIIRGT